LCIGYRIPNQTESLIELAPFQTRSLRLTATDQQTHQVHVYYEMATDCLVATGSTSPRTSPTQSKDVNNNLNNDDENATVSRQDDNDDKWETVYNHRDKQKFKLNQKNFSNNHRPPFNKSSKKDRQNDSPKSEIPTNDSTTTTASTNNENSIVSPTQVPPLSPSQNLLINAPPAPPPKHNPWAKIPDVKPIKLKGNLKYELARLLVNMAYL
jgi:hypothetical protein